MIWREHMVILRQGSYLVPLNLFHSPSICFLWDLLLYFFLFVIIDHPFKILFELRSRKYNLAMVGRKILNEYIIWKNLLHKSNTFETIYSLNSFYVLFVSVTLSISISIEASSPWWCFATKCMSKYCDLVNCMRNNVTSPFEFRTFQAYGFEIKRFLEILKDKYIVILTRIKCHTITLILNIVLVEIESHWCYIKSRIDLVITVILQILSC